MMANVVVSAGNAGNHWDQCLLAFMRLLWTWPERSWLPLSHQLVQRPQAPHQHTHVCIFTVPHRGWQHARNSRHVSVLDSPYGCTAPGTTSATLPFRELVTLCGATLPTKVQMLWGVLGSPQQYAGGNL